MYNVLSWLLETATKGFFRSLEDLNELGHFPLSTRAKEILSWRYSGVGSQSYDDDMYAWDFSIVKEFDTMIAEKIRRDSLQYMDPVMVQWGMAITTSTSQLRAGCAAREPTVS